MCSGKIWPNTTTLKFQQKKHFSFLLDFGVLGMARLENYDMYAKYRSYASGLVSVKGMEKQHLLVNFFLVKFVYPRG